MNWGNKILLTYIVFVIVILAMVFLSMQEKVDLVSKDYYAQELAFQQKIDASKNTADSGLSWKIDIKDSNVIISYSDSLQAPQINGTILFFRASDEDRDVKINIQLDKSGRQEIPGSKFIKGAYIVKLDWKLNGKNYFEQSNFYLN